MDDLIYEYKPEVFESEFLIVVIAMEVISSSSDIGDHILTSIRRGPQTQTPPRQGLKRVNLEMPFFSLYLSTSLFGHFTSLHQHHSYSASSPTLPPASSPAHEPVLWPFVCRGWRREDEGTWWICGLKKNNCSWRMSLFVVAALYHQNNGALSALSSCCWSSTHHQHHGLRNHNIITPQVTGMAAATTATRCLFIILQTPQLWGWNGFTYKTKIGGVVAGWVWSFLNFFSHKVDLTKSFSIKKSFSTTSLSWIMRY